MWSRKRFPLGIIIFGIKRGRRCFGLPFEPTIINKAAINSRPLLEVILGPYNIAQPPPQRPPALPAHLLALHPNLILFVGVDASFGHFCEVFLVDDLGDHALEGARVMGARAVLGV